MFRRHRLVAAAVLAALLILGSGCYRASYRTAQPAGGDQHAQWNSFFLWGLIGDAQVNVAAQCPQGLSRLVIQETAATFLISLVTLWLYSPLESVTYCASAPPLPQVPPGPNAPPSATESTP